MVKECASNCPIKRYNAVVEFVKQEGYRFPCILDGESMKKRIPLIIKDLSPKMKRIHRQGYLIRSRNKGTESFAV